ncbi:cobaltochelatase subunit CobN, partial [Klebsiella pneumoniae]
LTGLGFEEPTRMPAWGFLERDSKVATEDSRGTVGIIYYRAQHLAGNTHYIEALADAVEARGYVAKPIFAASLRT